MMPEEERQVMLGQRSGIFFLLCADQSRWIS